MYTKHLNHLGRMISSGNIDFRDVFIKVQTLDSEIRELDVRPFNFIVKETHHLAFFNPANIDCDYLFAVNMTSSPSLYGIKSIDCFSVYSALGIHRPLIESCRSSGYYAYTYVHKDLIYNKLSNTCINIARSNGLLHKREHLMVYNNLAKKFKIEYTSKILKSYHYSINKMHPLEDTKRSIIVQHDYDKFEKLTNSSLVKFINEYDTKNILLDIKKEDYDVLTLLGLNFFSEITEKNITLTLAEQGCEGSYYSSKNKDEIMNIIDNCY